MPASAASRDHLVEDRHEHVEPFDREARLAGERAMQEALEGLDLREPVEQRDRVDRIGGRAEASVLGRLAQPLALLGHEHVRVVVAGRRAVDAAERRRRLPASSTGRRQSGDGIRLAGSRRRSSSVTPCVARAGARDRPTAATRADRAARRGGRSAGSTARD